MTANPDSTIEFFAPGHFARSGDRMPEDDRRRELEQRQTVSRCGLAHYDPPNALRLALQ
jgi:hypothetical protein